jgi:molybdopterin molybdotransferase
MTKEQMGYKEALNTVLATISSLDSEQVGLAEGQARVVSEDLYSRVDSPSADSSMKDGYAVWSDDIRNATPQNRVRMDVIDMAAAGNPARRTVTSGTAIRILTGAAIPGGTNAVLSEEFADRRGDVLSVFNDAGPGRNILPKGADVAVGELIAARGSCLSPGRIGLLAAGGHSTLSVYRRPRLAILATGDELVAPGQSLPDGKLYASNLEMLNAWSRRCGMYSTVSILKDRRDIIAEKISAAVAAHDAVITSGGAWSGDRDYVADTLDSLGWEKIFHRIRMGPGKALGFGLLDGKPVFLLPGGPPSNLTAFLQIALPGLLKLAGHDHPSLPHLMVKLSDGLTGRNRDWTEFVYGTLEAGQQYTVFKPLRQASRLKTIAEAEGVIAIPEGRQSLPAGALITAQILV